jgi:hypothetical protein
LKPGNAISCILSIQTCSKIYANYITNFIIFAISHHHSYTGVFYIWQGILKAINIGIIIAAEGSTPNLDMKVSPEFT